MNKVLKNNMEHMYYPMTISHPSAFSMAYLVDIESENGSYVWIKQKVFPLKG